MGRHLCLWNAFIQLKRFYSNSIAQIHGGFFSRDENEIRSYRDATTEYINASMNLHHAKFIRLLIFAFFQFLHVLEYEWMESAAEEREQESERSSHHA